MAHAQKGEKDEARKWFDKAAAWTKEKDPKNAELLRFWKEAAELLGEPRADRGWLRSRVKEPEVNGASRHFSPPGFATRRKRGAMEERGDRRHPSSRRRRPVRIHPWPTENRGVRISVLRIPVESKLKAQGIGQNTDGRAAINQSHAGSERD